MQWCSFRLPTMNMWKYAVIFRYFVCESVQYRGHSSQANLRHHSEKKLVAQRSEGLLSFDQVIRNGQFVDVVVWYPHLSTGFVWAI
jgi:hypothetical protein